MNKMIKFFISYLFSAMEKLPSLSTERYGALSLMSCNVIVTFVTADKAGKFENSPSGISVAYIVLCKSS